MWLNFEWEGYRKTIRHLRVVKNYVWLEHCSIERHCRCVWLHVQTVHQPLPSTTEAVKKRWSATVQQYFQAATGEVIRMSRLGLFRD